MFANVRHQPRSVGRRRGESQLYRQRSDSEHGIELFEVTGTRKQSKKGCSGGCLRRTRANQDGNMKSRRAQVWRESADVLPTIRRGLSMYYSDHMPQDALQRERCIHSENI